MGAAEDCIPRFRGKSTPYSAIASFKAKVGQLRACRLPLKRFGENRQKPPKMSPNQGPPNEGPDSEALHASSGRLTESVPLVGVRYWVE